MRHAWLVIALVVVGSFAGLASPAHADVSVGVNFFYDDLARHGDWFEMDDYGWVWTPRYVSADWRPYTRGRWVWSDDYGWLWLSDDAFGWATCHYGRWFYDAGRGWVWVPGREWAPAWVSWRAGGGYVGWAPLTPEYRWGPSAGFRAGNFDVELHIAPRHYVFVPERHFFDPGAYRRALPYARNAAFVDVTRNVTNYALVGDRVVNRGVTVQEVERASGRRVTRYRVEERTSPTPRAPVVERDRVRIFRPTPRQIEQAPPPRAPRPPVETLVRVRPRPEEPPADPRTLARPGGPGQERSRQEQARREEEARALQAEERRRAQQRAQQRQEELGRQRQVERQRAQQEQALREQARQEQARQERARQQQQQARTQAQQQQAQQQRERQQADERQQQAERQQLAERRRQQEARQQQLERQRAQQEQVQQEKARRAQAERQRQQQEQQAKRREQQKRDQPPPKKKPKPEEPG
jgi:hypothetical protein